VEVGHREDEGGGIGAEGLELGGRRYQARARSSLARTTSARTPTFSAAAIHLSGNALHQPELAQVIDAQVRFHLHAMRVGPEGDYLTPWGRSRPRGDLTTVHPRCISEWRGESGGRGPRLGQ